MRGLLLAGLIAAAIAAMLWSRRTAAADVPVLTYVTTAHQLGVVGYRDPPGAISADGAHVAFAEGRRLFETPLGGGVRTELAVASAQIRYVAPYARGRAWIFEDAATPSRWWIAAAGAAKRPLFRAATLPVAGVPAGEIQVSTVRQAVGSPDGAWIAAIVAEREGAALIRVPADGPQAEVLHRGAGLAWPAWSSTTDVACVLTTDGRARVSVPCGQAPLRLDPDVDVVGPIAFSAADGAVYFASPNPAGMVDLWRADLATRAARRLTGFSRDSYAPSVDALGRVLFKVQSYRTSVAELDLASGRFQQLSTLQAETPSYHPDGRRIAVTYGTWRRLLDDAKYPDIAQEIGVISAMPIDVPAASPLGVIAASDSEDQAMTWSPNGQWIALHSHREQSDDIWLRPADGRAPDRRVSFLGRGAETGWPRWSGDGTRVLFNGASPASRRSALFVIAIDQNTGEVTAQPREMGITGVDGEITHAEWLPGSTRVVAIARSDPGRHVIFTVGAAGGAAAVVHEFASEHDFAGLAVSPDGARVAFVAPAPDGFYQVWAMPLSGESAAQQLTIDGTHKTQPAWSPDGRRIAYTVWSYDVQFWTVASPR